MNMDISSTMNAAQTQSYDYDYKTKTKSKADKAGASTEEAASKTATKDTAASNGVIYEPSTRDKIEADKAAQQASLIEHLKAASKDTKAQLAQMVKDTLFSQANNASGLNLNININIEININAADETQSSSDDEDYWGAEATSQRIIDFAKSLCGGDSSKIDTLKDAFLKGYEKAGSAWGSDLPSVCKDTYDLVLKKFDDWANESSTSTASAE
jgi:hypothetical protein